jgi:hypothetical protein
MGGWPPSPALLPQQQIAIAALIQVKTARGQQFTSPLTEGKQGGENFLLRSPTIQ